MPRSFERGIGVVWRSFRNLLERKVVDDVLVVISDTNAKSRNRADAADRDQENDQRILNETLAGLLASLTEVSPWRPMFSRDVRHGRLNTALSRVRGWVGKVEIPVSRCPV